MDYMLLIRSFIVGGLLCAIAQILIDKTKLTSARIMVLYVVVGVILTALGLYEPLVNFASCGATTPIIGFGYSLCKGVEKEIAQKGVMGIFSGGLKATSLGITTVIFLAVLMALIFKPKPKK